jgi:hypothetical protein
MEECEIRVREVTSSGKSSLTIGSKAKHSKRVNVHKLTASVQTVA